MDALLVTMACTAVGAALSPDLSHVETFIMHTTYELRRKFRPQYHVSAPFGWLNDPAAFVYFNSNYHMFYQYYPYDGAWGPLHWGHVVSKDLVNWKHYPPALVPRSRYDRHGCLAGSVFEYNGYLALFYTGEDLIANRTRQTQNVAVSSDGVMFQKYLYNPIIAAPPDNAIDFRNPKVWRNEKDWYMIVGSSVKGRGRLELYTSTDLYKWRFNNTIAESFGDLGHLWESPDVFELDGLNVLLVSVRGVRYDGFRFRNLHQSGYVIGHFDYRRALFDDLEVSKATFAELDFGHDFYAPKTALSTDGRRLLVAWLGMWESDFLESNEGWAGAMTLVREVKVGRHGRLCTPPAREMLKLRAETLEHAWYDPGEAFLAGGRAFELEVKSVSALNDAVISLEWGGQQGYTVTYSASKRYMAVDRGGADGERRADYSPSGSLFWRIFVDRSSVEVFVGQGEVVFSSRVYPRNAISVRVGGDTRLLVSQYRMRRTIGFDLSIKKYLKEQVLPKPSFL